MWNACNIFYTLTAETAPVTRSSIDLKDSVFLRAPSLLLTAVPSPPNKEVVFSAVALIADSVFWYLDKKNNKNA